jgi:hypothetical protein
VQFGAAADVRAVSLNDEGDFQGGYSSRSGSSP